MISSSDYLDAVLRNFEALRELSDDIDRAGTICVEALRGGGKIIFCGNGGSAADCQHLAAELMGRFLRDRSPLPALSLTVDTSALTAIGNDYGYEEIFARQLCGIGRAGDVLIGISTSGTSRNVVRAFETALKLNIRPVAFTGEVSSPMSEMAEHTIQVPSRLTNHVQEMHIAIGHIICGIVETELC